MKRNLVICGDLHGSLKELVWKVKQGSDILVVGDIGVGFGRPLSFEVLVGSLKKRLESKDLRIYCIRGNHDNPEYFDGRTYEDRVTLLQDHVPLTLGDRLIYPVGGAPSHDKDHRLRINERLERFGSKKRIWWEGECIVPGVNRIPPKIDILLSHDSPTYFDPPLIREDGQSWETYVQVRSGRRYLSSILQESNVKQWFFGHYHTSFTGTHGNCSWRGLAPLELYYVPE